MKKLVLGLILVAGLFTTISAYAETLAAGRVNVGSVHNIISRKYTAEIDEDGDIAIETDNGLIYITVIKDAKLLRIFSVYKPSLVRPSYCIGKALDVNFVSLGDFFIVTLAI